MPKPRRVSASIRVPIPWCFLAHSLATLGHETAASTTTTITRKAAPLQGSTGKNGKKPAAQKDARKALLSDIGLFGLLYETSFFQLVMRRKLIPNASHGFSVRADVATVLRLDLEPPLRPRAA